MKQTYTSIPPILKKQLCHFILFFAFMVPFAAQSQNTTSDDLEKQMHTLYEKAHQLYDNLPQRDYRGYYLTMTMGISPWGHIKTWQTEDICDCEGNIVGTKEVQSFKMPIAWTLGFENRLFNAFSIRVNGSFARLSHQNGKNVVAENGVFTQMQDNYTLKQIGINGSVLGHYKNFYIGLGVSRTLSMASGFQTQLNYPENKSKYYQLEADIKSARQNDITPQTFVGYRLMLSPNVFSSVELGLAQKFYFNVQISIPLSTKTKYSLQVWKKEFDDYNFVRLQALAIDKELHPQKFQSNDCVDTGGGSGGNCR